MWGRRALTRALPNLFRGMARLERAVSLAEHAGHRSVTG